MVSAMRVMALLLRSKRLGVGRPMISEVVCEIWDNLFLLETDSIVRKQGEHCRAVWLELHFYFVVFVQ